jgi:hypothetical protein
MKHSAERLNESKPRRTSSTEKLGKAARSNEVVERARPQVQPAAHGHSSRDRTRQWPRHNSGNGTWSAGTLRETETKPRQTREEPQASGAEIEGRRLSDCCALEWFKNRIRTETN